MQGQLFNVNLDKLFKSQKRLAILSSLTEVMESPRASHVIFDFGDIICDITSELALLITQMSKRIGRQITITPGKSLCVCVWLKSVRNY